MKTYAEYLTELGASADDLKVMDTPVARKAYDKLQADLAESERVRAIADKDLHNYKEWYEKTAVPQFRTMQQETVAAKAEAAKARTLILAAQEEGLAELAKQAGYEPEKKVETPAAVAAGVPTSDWEERFLREKILPIAQQEGAAIALAQDIAAEHKALFPDRPLNFTQLRNAAMAANKPVEQYWQETYNVFAAREARAAADKKAAEDAIRADERKKVEAELVSKFANPDTRPLSTSRFPTTPRPERGREKQPWEVGDRANERVANITTKLLQSQVQRTN